LQAHGYATNEFEVTVERLGVYLPVWIFSVVVSNDYSFLIIQAEHIDNPKGYGAGEDVRRFDPRLRGPVDVCT
jgi:Heterokaryon incompatibility protein Het-C